MALERNTILYPRKLIVVSFGRNLRLVIISILLMCFGTRNALSLMSAIINPCESGTYITIDFLFTYCGLPGICGKELACEGKTALVQGYIDYGNVFDKKAYPMLPYQKFLITNAEHSKTMEVWVVSDGSDAIFKKIAGKKASNPDSPVYVKGVLDGFDMPIMGACHRGLKLNLTAVASLSYDGDGILPAKPSHID
jgi:hypothetical protein